MRSILIEILDWWEENQFNTYGRDYNVYTEDPDFVVEVKNRWVETFGEENPNNWSWIN